MQAADKARSRLQSKGLRVTLQRLAVLQILEESEEHLDAQAVYTRARARAPDLSLATVYRILNKLTDTGLVAQRCFDPPPVGASYETTSKDAHHHFVCLGCGKIVEMPASVLDPAAQKLARQFDIVLSRVNLKGYCGECMKQLGKKPIDCQAVT